MNSILKIILIFSSFFFLVFILNMIKSKKIELQYAITWLITSIIFILLAIFPNIVSMIANVLHIEIPINALFLLIQFLFINILFSLSIALGNCQYKVKELAQEIGLLKLEIDLIKKENYNKE